MRPRAWEFLAHALDACASPDQGAADHAGLYQAGVRNMYFGARALAPWMLNAAFQAGCMVAMVLAATAPTVAARADGSTWSHWEVSSPLSHDT